jgi:polyhydroxyalkanoate synthesis regulator phasin
VDPITTISGPVDANAFIDNTSIASGEATLAEVVQIINKVNEVIGGLVQVAGEISDEEAARAAADAVGDVADAALDARLDTAEGYITLLQTGFSDHTALIQDLENRVSDLEYVTASGYVEKSSGDLTLAADTEHTINFTGTAGQQVLSLPTTMTTFTNGQNWRVVCNNEDGVRIVSSAWAHEAITSGNLQIALLPGDIADITAVDVGSTKKWSAAVMRGGGGFRGASAGAGDLGSVDNDDRFIWVNRQGDTGTRDLYLPNLAGSDSPFHDHREITVVLYGTPSSGTFVVNVAPASSDTFIDGATTFTMTENSACRFVGNGSLIKWAAIVGGAM